MQQVIKTPTKTTLPQFWVFIFLVAIKIHEKIIVYSAYQIFTILRQILSRTTLEPRPKSLRDKAVYETLDELTSKKYIRKMTPADVHKLGRRTKKANSNNSGAPGKFFYECMPIKEVEERIISELKENQIKVVKFSYAVSTREEAATIQNPKSKKKKWKLKN